MSYNYFSAHFLLNFIELNSDFRLGKTYVRINTPPSK